MAQQDQHGTADSRMVKDGKQIQDHATSTCPEGTVAEGKCTDDLVSAGVDSSDLTTGRGQSWATGQSGAAGVNNPGSAGGPGSDKAS